MVLSLGPGLKFPLLPSGPCPNYPLQDKFAVTASGLSPILPCQRGCSFKSCKAKRDNKVECNLLGLGWLRNFAFPTLSMLHEIWNFGIFAIPPSWYHMKFWKTCSFPDLNFTSSTQQSITKSSEALFHWGGSSIWVVCLDPFFDYGLEYVIRLLKPLYFWVTWDILEAGFLWSRFTYQ